MASFSNLIGSFMQNAMSSSGSNRIGNALGQLQRTGQGGGLDSVLGQLGGGLRSAANNPLQSGGIGAVAGALLGGRGGAVGGGALGMLASVAMQALQGAGQQAADGTAVAGTPDRQLSLATRTPQSPQEVEAVESQAQLVLKGMINAAKADGQISPSEMQRILGKLEEAGADAEMQQWVMTQMAEPLDLAAFIAEIPSAEVAAEVYAGSLLAIEVDTDAERDYLQQLAQGTGLHPLVVNQIHQTLGVPA